ncbi:hypothetical protein E2K80_18780 [Rhodophyticola sp. CCM32]|uniref:COG4315 family predicted lipoprotein n=1 Tax=Rhodophyticola sp. CCM32 TaxID=2916397 RepID=UPI00107F06A0|nr:hypothetical protein [Rhodophyticola sp. CCM32]QBY02531.1 hypothetical protein E2K80_18780 [Rhodophyticola sp. CCM32]
MNRKLIAACIAMASIAAPALADPVTSFNTDIGDVLAAADNGMTVYTFTQDTPNQSNCYESCASAWPPFLASDTAEAEGAFGIIDRNDGTRQWALNGQPLYFWQGDAERGDVTGHGVGGVWFAAQN